MNPAVRAFLNSKVRNLASRARRLAQLDHESVGIRPQDVPYTPSAGHFAAANARLAEIDGSVQRQLARLHNEVRDPAGSSESILEHLALVEREVDRARRAFGLFFEVFGQRGSSFGPALAACDAIAADCFLVVHIAAPGVIRRPLLKPVAYLEHSFSPATFRRGVLLGRLLGERNPFPLVRIPYERVESPWGMGVVLHEIGHNLQADMTVWQETRLAVQRRVLSLSGSAWITRIWGRWHKEIFADLIALLLGGPASAKSMMDFLAYPAARVLTFRPMGVHPTAYLRAFVLAQMLERMGFPEDAARARSVWRSMYSRFAHSARIPAPVLASAEKIIPHVVDEIAYQTRRGLGQRALADVVPFRPEDQREIEQAARHIARGRVPPSLPARFAVSASRYAFDRGLAPPRSISRTVLGELARRQARANSRTQGPTESVAA
jgi:hypothetical protein